MKYILDDRESGDTVRSDVMELDGVLYLVEDQSVRRLDYTYEELSKETTMSSTHTELVSEGYHVVIQHCEEPGCDVFLGVNYPDKFCAEHRNY